MGDLPDGYRIIVLFSIVITAWIPVLFNRKLERERRVWRPSNGCTNLVSYIIIIRCAVKVEASAIISHAAGIISGIAFQPAVCQTLLSVDVGCPMIVEPIAQLGIQSTACNVRPVPVKMLQIAPCCQPSMLAERGEIGGIDLLCKASAMRSMLAKGRHDAEIDARIKAAVQASVCEIVIGGIRIVWLVGRFVGVTIVFALCIDVVRTIVSRLVRQNF